MGSLPQSATAFLSQSGSYVVIQSMQHNKNDCAVLKNASVFHTNAKFIVEKAYNDHWYTGDYDLVHIKSSYNNKYLCRRSKDSDEIAAVGDKPEEITSLWTCTKFRPERRDGSFVELLYLGATSSLDYYGRNMVRSLDGILTVEGTDTSKVGSQVLLKLVDVDALIRLPKRVSFKGDNGKYLCTIIFDNIAYNSFLNDDNSDQEAQYEIVENRHGEILIKSVLTDKFLRYDDEKNGLIVADVDSSLSPDSAKGSETFQIVKVGDNVIALRNKAAGGFCIREPPLIKDGGLKASSDETSVVREGRFVVGEPVFERKIDVQFDFKRAKIHGKEVVQAATISVNNVTDDKHSLAQGFVYTKTHSAKWETTNELKIGTEATISAGVPFIANESLKLTAEYTREWMQGQSEDYSKQINSTYSVNVPAKTKVTVNLISEEAKYDIPYSYYQSDIYKTGERVTRFISNGIYRGVEAFNFYYEPKYEPLEPKSDDKSKDSQDSKDSKDSKDSATLVS